MLLVIDVGNTHTTFGVFQQEKLLAHFSADPELNAKSAWFLQNLSPHLRQPEIERKYRLNYLAGKFAIPALD